MTRQESLQRILWLWQVCLCLWSILYVCLLDVAIHLIASILQTIQQTYHISMVNIARTSTTSYEIIRSIAEEGNVLNLLNEWQYILVVLQQHHSLGSGIASHQSMALQIRVVVSNILLETRSLHDILQDMAYIAVEDFHRQATIEHSLANLLHLVCLTWHQQVVTRFHLGSSAKTTKPVGHHHTLESPLMAKNLCYQVTTLTRHRTIDEIVRSHHCPRLSLLDNDFERFQVNLTESTWITDNIVTSTIGLLVVQCEVLQRSTYIVALDTIHHSCTNGTSQQWIF